MAETTGATEAQAAEVTQPQAGADSPSQAEGVKESGTGNSDLAAAVRERDEARREAAKYRTEARKLAEAQTAADEAKLSELEKATKRVAELERQQAESQVRDQERTVQLATLEAASRLNFRNPDLAYRLLDRSEIEFDDGKPKNVEKLLKALLEKEPYLAKTAQADYGGGNRGTTPSGQPTMNELIRAAARNG